MPFTELYRCTNHKHILTIFHASPLSFSVWTVSPQRLLQDVIIVRWDLAASCHKAWLWPPCSTPLLSQCLGSSVLLRDKPRNGLSRLIKPTVNTFFGRQILEEEVHRISSPHQLITRWTYWSGPAWRRFWTTKTCRVAHCLLLISSGLLDTWTLTVFLDLKTHTVSIRNTWQTHFTAYKLWVETTHFLILYLLCMVKYLHNWWFKGE